MSLSNMESHTRSLCKAISWRILGSLDTFVVALVLTGKPLAAGSIASAEVLTKTLLYYLHERGWAFISRSATKVVSH